MDYNKAQFTYDNPWMAASFQCKECGAQSESLAVKSKEMYYECKCGQAYTLMLTIVVKPLTDSLNLTLPKQ